MCELVQRKGKVFNKNEKMGGRQQRRKHDSEFKQNAVFITNNLIGQFEMCRENGVSPSNLSIDGAKKLRDRGERAFLGHRGKGL